MKWTALTDRRRKWIRWGVALGSIPAICAGLWQFDWIRQNVQLEWLAVTGRSWRVRGHISTISVWSPALRESRRALVYTPPGYDSLENRVRRYPVLYLLHGIPGSPDDWIRYGRAPEVAERLAARRALPPMILVCPDGNGDGYMNDSEYVDALLSPSGKGPGKQIGTFIARDLPAWTDAHYRTIANPKARILAGVSTGGYGAVNLALTNPGVFDTVFSFSGYYTAEQSGWARPVWGYHPSAASLRSQSPAEYVTSPRPAWSNLWIYLGDGRNERGPYAEEGEAFAARLRAAGVPCDHVVMAGRHSWDLWRPQLRDALTRSSARIEEAGANSRH